MRYPGCAPSWLLAAALTAAAPVLAQPAASAAAGSAPAAKAASGPFAVVGDVVISASDYERALAVAIRRKYYHAKPPEAEMPKFQREVGDDVINRVLLLAEARRRGIQPDAARIQQTIAGYDAQYKTSANWAANRDKMLAAVVPQLEGESLLDRLEKLVKTVSPPAEPVARQFYEQNQALFVEPEQLKLSVILLKVDPSSTRAVWQSAMNEAKALHQRLLGGADFAELARLHSGDRSAAQGGQMDYTHRGMLPDGVHGVVDKLKPREIAEPVQLLEGVVILRLDDRKPTVQRSFDQVKVRAAELWQRQEAESQWKKLIAELRRATPIRVDESLYAPLPPSSERPRAS
ncbi:MAG: peptidylprolyl isomerase [Rubrivivax sp.]|nr:peptidylprolyl isomerase [Rubrivivax sp.]